MAALWLRKKKICALAEDTGRRFWVRKILQERKKYGLYHILTAELRLFDKDYFFRFVRMTPQRFRFVRMTPQRFRFVRMTPQRIRCVRMTPQRFRCVRMTSQRFRCVRMTPQRFEHLL